VTDLLAATLLAALVAGLAGSTHCLAMCGGIAGALGLSSRAAAERSGRPLAYPLAYNAGRIASYTLAGAIVGGIGAGMGRLAGADSARLALQLAAGVVLVVLGLRRINWRCRSGTCAATCASLVYGTSHTVERSRASAVHWWRRPAPRRASAHWRDIPRGARHRAY